MKLIKIVKNQEAQCKLSLTESERESTAAFFMAREVEQKALDAVNHTKTEGIASVSCTALREDIPAPKADRKAFLDISPDTDGAFVKVPRTL